MVCTMSNLELCGSFFEKNKKKKVYFFGVLEGKEKKAWEQDSVVETVNIALEIIWVGNQKKRRTFPQQNQSVEKKRGKKQFNLCCTKNDINRDVCFGFHVL